MKKNAGSKAKNIFFNSLILILFVLVLGLFFNMVFKNGGPEIAFGGKEVGDLNEETTVASSADERIVEATGGSIFDGFWKWFTAELLPGNILRWELPAISYVDDSEAGETHASEDMDTVRAPDGDFFIEFEKDIPEDIRIEINNMQTEDNGPLIESSNGPQVLIYHTHTEEAYMQSGEDTYVEAGSWRTNEREKNIIEIGTLLAKELQEKYGFNVLHSKKDHEPPSLSTAYDRSLKTMQSYKKKYPSLQMFIDLHRDAYDVTKKRDYVTIDGKDVARVMFVVGTASGARGEAYTERPNWKENYKLAARITNELNTIKKDFARPIRVKTGRYNQQVSPMAMLIEVGHNGNTLQEAKNAVPYIAKAISKTIRLVKVNGEDRTMLMADLD